MGAAKLLIELFEVFFDGSGLDLTIQWDAINTFKEYLRVALYFFPWETARTIFACTLAAQGCRVFFSIVKLVVNLGTMIASIVK